MFSSTELNRADTHKKIVRKKYTGLLCMTGILKWIIISLTQHMTYLFMVLYLAGTGHGVLADLPA